MEVNQLDAFVTELRKRGRVLVLGGGAVIALGLQRATKDADIWLEPHEEPSLWAKAVQETLEKFPAARATRLFPSRDIPADEIEQAIIEDRVIRIMGMEMPLDIFRQPNELEDYTFDEVWKDSEPFSGEVNMLPPHVLLVTKENTERIKDQADITFIQGILRQRMIPVLKTCSSQEAAALFAKYIDSETLEAAIANPDPQVHALGKAHLHQFAEEGDPFAIDSWNRLFGPL